MRTGLAIGTSGHLGIIEIRVHDRSVVDEPSIDEPRDVGGIGGLPGQHPRHRVVEDGIRHVSERTDIVNETCVGVEQAISSVIRAGDPYCKPIYKYVDLIARVQ